MRFSLSSLLLVPLLFSPLLMSVLLIEDELARRPPRMGLTIIGFAAAYCLALLGNWLARARIRGRQIRSPVYSCVMRGALYGARFAAFLILPLFSVFAVRELRDPVPFWVTASQDLVPIFAGFGYFLLTFSVLGGATGGLLGLGMRWSQCAGGRRAAAGTERGR
jgi:hypothetical protein